MRGGGVLHSTADANIGPILSIGFAAWSGGTLQFINQYGLKDFIVRVQHLVEQHGEHFESPVLLLEKAAKGELFRVLTPYGESGFGLAFLRSRAAADDATPVSPGSCQPGRHGQGE